MKSFCIFTAVFLFVGICSAAAQDIIILKDGNTIAAKVSEISPTEIRYKRFDNLDGPTIVIPADRVLSIRYQNGTQEIINADTKTVQKNTQTKPETTALDPDKFIFAFNTNTGSLIPMMYLGGPSLNLEFGKGNFNSEVNLFLPVFYSSGFGGLATFNYFWHKRYGGFYLGGGLGYISLYFDNYESHPSYNYESYTTAGIITIGLNVGWKFVTRSGIYFRTGAYFGPTVISWSEHVRKSYYGNSSYDESYNNDYIQLSVYFKPDLAIGFCFK